MSISVSSLIRSYPVCPNVFVTQECEFPQAIEEKWKTNSKARFVHLRRGNLSLWHCRYRREALVRVQP